MSTDTTPAVAGAIETVASHLHPTPSWDLSDHPEPTGREEIWRFTPMKRIAPLLRAKLTSDNLDWQTSIPEGVTLSSISKEEARELAVEAPLDRVSALAAENAAYGVRLDIPAELEVAEPIQLTGTGVGGVVSEHTVITVGAFAKATIILHYLGEGTFAEKTDIRVGDGAQVSIVTLQDWADKAVHGGQRSVLVGRDASVKMVTASLGGDVIRLQEDVRYAGPGGELNQYGVYFVDAGQHIQHRIFVDHNAPRTKSNVDYRGALQGQGAHSVWIGDVLIRKVAEEIETYEANKNLVLTEGAKADSVPNLEIETGEIAGAGHSSTTGRFDDNQLFYLMSRGIPEAEARRLVVHGFFVDIVRRIGVEAVEERLMQAVEKELAVVTQTLEAEK
ncbi:MAG: Fe-S cluster assembly protein SufD [Luteococcus sp.]|uniref:Fe-S cluster assembly protein SufD n=1 Tax=Luteococcus sp. TaxID=1969402 RepID=UPI002648140D|nr:Fe-S cluster assembly protein SufD [Luteococcus sp.]MDN5563857.1 Fe-S cluster assembly protein SufD [Luteococcus sp.]